MRPVHHENAQLLEGVPPRGPCRKVAQAPQQCVRPGDVRGRGRDEVRFHSVIFCQRWMAASLLESSFLSIKPQLNEMTKLFLIRF